MATRMAYDRLGRMVSRTERDLTNNWYYDRDQAGADCPYGKGKLCEVDSTGSMAGGGPDRKYAFDDKGRLAQSVSTVEATAVGHMPDSRSRAFAIPVECTYCDKDGAIVYVDLFVDEHDSFVELEVWKSDGSDVMTYFADAALSVKPMDVKVRKSPRAG